jgi:endonuclease YncB( thermonuclease family)
MIFACRASAAGRSATALPRFQILLGLEGAALNTSVALACVFAAGFAATALADDKTACRPETVGPATVRAVADGRTLTLTDAREVRLAGIEVPSEGENGAAARAALETLVSGRDIRLLKMGPDSDRYGRFVGGIAADGPPIQLELLNKGHALVAAQAADTKCAAAFMTAEKAARAAGLGVWGTAYYLTQDAENPAQILASRGRFAVVEGKVLSVRESGATIYVNFGRRWTEDFTVTALKRNERTFSDAGLPLKKLEGRRVRIRGTVEERGGPWIEAMHPGQIEIVEQR